LAADFAAGLALSLGLFLDLALLMFPS